MNFAELVKLIQRTPITPQRTLQEWAATNYDDSLPEAVLQQARLLAATLAMVPVAEQDGGLSTITESALWALPDLTQR